MSVEFMKMLLANLDQAMAHLREVKQYRGHPLYPEGLTNRFRLAYETIKTLLIHYLQYREVKKPVFHGELLELGMQLELLPKNSAWHDMLADRNSLTHEYSPPDFLEICEAIEQRYNNLLEISHANFTREISKLN